MTTYQRLKYIAIHWRVWKHFVEHPVFTMQLLCKRVGLTFTRRFVGDTLVSPVTGEQIFNIQSLVNYWSMHVVRELGDEWQKEIRETISPVIFDVGANIGQFGRLVMSMNPSAKVIAFEPWPGMSEFNGHARKFHQKAASDLKSSSELNIAQSEGWTATTSESYGHTKALTCQTVMLDDVWMESGCPEITVLKIDVDGAEDEVIRGAREMLEHTKIILMESNLHPVRLSFWLNRWIWKTHNGVDWIGVLIPQQPAIAGREMITPFEDRHAALHA